MRNNDRYNRWFSLVTPGKPESSKVSGIDSIDGGKLWEPFHMAPINTYYAK
jgi:hypothetical protein